MEVLHGSADVVNTAAERRAAGNQRRSRLAART
jgi:hypothetical protein